MKKKELMEFIDQNFTDDDNILFVSPCSIDYDLSESPSLSYENDYAVNSTLVRGRVVFGA
jgi:hypothetical protein